MYHTFPMYHTMLAERRREHLRPTLTSHMLLFLLVQQEVPQAFGVLEVMMYYADQPPVLH